MEDKKNKDNSETLDFEEAINLTGYGLYNIFLLILCGGLLMGVILETMSVSYIISIAECDLNLSLSEKTLLSAIGFLGIVLSSLLWGLLGDTLGRRNLIIITTFLTFFTTVLSVLSPYGWFLILLRFINGFFAGGPSAVTYAYLGEFHNNSYRPMIVMGASTFIALALLILPSIAWIILPMTWSFDVPGLNFAFQPWRLYLILCGIPGVLCALLLLLLYPESPKFLWVNGKSDKALEILSKIYARNTGNSKYFYPVKKLADQTEKNSNDSSGSTKSIKALLITLQKQVVPLFHHPNLKNTFKCCALQMGIFASCGSFLTWGPIILNKISRYTEEYNTDVVTICGSFNEYSNTSKILQETNSTDLIKDCNNIVEIKIYKISVIIYSIYITVYVLNSFAIKLIGKKILLTGMLCLTGLAGFTLNYLNDYLTIVTLMTTFVISGTCNGTVAAIVVDLYPTNLRSMALALSLMFARCGIFIGANVVGILLETYCTLPFYLFPSLLLVLAIISVTLPLPWIVKKDVNS